MTKEERALAEDGLNPWLDDAAPRGMRHAHAETYVDAVRDAADDFANGRISAGRLAEVLGCADKHAFEATAHSGASERLREAVLVLLNLSRLDSREQRCWCDERFMREAVRTAEVTREPLRHTQTCADARALFARIDADRKGA